MTRKLVFRIGIAIVVIGLLSLGYRLMFPARFDVARWRSASSPAEFHARHEMMGAVNRLFADHTLHNRESILLQLGPPQQGDVEKDNVWLYDLGGRLDESAPGAHDWLEVTFTNSGTVATHRVRQGLPE
jgi:hypothetical protein